MKTTTSFSPILLLSIIFFGFQHQANAQLDTNDFVTTWQTDKQSEFPSTFVGNDSTIYIHADSNYTYNYDVDWNNDGIFDTLGLTTSILHQYSNPGIYTIRIRGDFPSIKFGWGIYKVLNGTIQGVSIDNNAQKLLRIDQWGNTRWRNLESAFYYCENLEDLGKKAPLLDSTTSLSFMLSGCLVLNSSIEHWDVSNIKNFSFFLAGTGLFNQPLNNWDVSNATDIQGMFYVSQKFNQDLSNWDVSNVVNMSECFEQSRAFNNDVSTWDVSNVTTMEGMFCFSEFNQPINNWDVSNVTNMKKMFAINYVFNQSLNNWDMSNVTDISRMFYYTPNFNQSLSNWDVSNLKNAEDLFNNATKFDQSLANWKLDSVENMQFMLNNSGLSKANYDSTLIAWQKNMMQDSITLGAQGLRFCQAELARDTLKNRGWIINGDVRICDTTVMVITLDSAGGPGSSSNVSIFTSPYYTYNYDVDWDNDGTFDTLGVSGDITHTYPEPSIYTIAIRGTFPTFKFGYNSYNGNRNNYLLYFHQWGDIQYLKLDSSFYEAYSMYYTAEDQPSLDSISSLIATFARAYYFNGKIEKWDISGITDLSYLFYNAANFNQEINSWDVSQVTNMSNMFNGDYRFSQNLDQWDVSNVIDMSLMFERAFDFNQPLNMWNVSNVNNMAAMFFDANSFNQPLNNWDVSIVSDMSGMFAKAISFNQPLDNWDVSGLFGAANMFREATNFNQNLGSWNISSLNFAINMFDSSAMSLTNYDSTLIAWQTKSHPSNLLLGVAGLKYCTSKPARDSLIADGWTFVGDSLDPACIITGLNNLASEVPNSSEILLYPNPTSGILNIEIENLELNQPLFIYNQMGQLVREHQLTTGINRIDLSRQAKGVYFVRYGRISKKVILVD